MTVISRQERNLRFIIKPPEVPSILIPGLYPLYQNAEAAATGKTGVTGLLTPLILYGYNQSKEVNPVCFVQV
jgi:hypothetical protein